jgi:bifunctional DNA-binding transcriptional regulator/antitoxin component of YhaV-PrlF toxin-antitoxin module
MVIITMKPTLKTSAVVRQQYKITLDVAVQKSLGLRIGDVVEIEIRKIETPKETSE